MWWEPSLLYCGGCFYFLTYLFTSIISNMNQKWHEKAWKSIGAFISVGMWQGLLCHFSCPVFLPVVLPSNRLYRRNGKLLVYCTHCTITVGAASSRFLPSHLYDRVPSIGNDLWLNSDAKWQSNYFVHFPSIHSTWRLFSAVFHGQSQGISLTVKKKRELLTSSSGRPSHSEHIALNKMCTLGPHSVLMPTVLRHCLYCLGDEW